MQGAEDEDEGSVLMYVTEAQIPKATQQIAFVQQSLLRQYLKKNEDFKDMPHPIFCVMG